VDQPVLVNQSGYDLDRPKRFTAPKAADGETFTITDAAGQTRFTGTVHGQVGDFTAFRPGNSAGGSALSAPHVVGDPVRVDESFSDDFADGTVEPWQPVSGSWQVRDGRLEVTGTASTLKALASLNGYRYTADLTASAAVRINASRDADSWAGLMVARRRTTDSYTDSGYTAFIRVNGTVVLIKPESVVARCCDHAGIRGERAGSRRRAGAAAGRGRRRPGPRVRGTRCPAGDRRTGHDVSRRHRRVALDVQPGRIRRRGNERAVTASGTTRADAVRLTPVP
jgi:hypothetical protein